MAICPSMGGAKVLKSYIYTKQLVWFKLFKWDSAVSKGDVQLLVDYKVMYDTST